MDLKTYDVDATGHELATAFGWQTQVDPDDWRGATKAWRDGQWLAGLSDLDSPIYPPGTPPHTSYYLRVDDVATIHDRAVEHGATSLLEPSPIADQGVLAMVLDPFGAAVALWQPEEFAGWTHATRAWTPALMVHESASPDAAAAFYRDNLGLAAAEFVGACQQVDGAGWIVVISTQAVRPTSRERVRLNSGLEFLRG